MSTSKPSTTEPAVATPPAEQPSSEPTIEQLLERQPVEVVERDGVRYTLLGTAHVSKTSAEVVEHMIQSGDFDSVAVELCSSRYEAMTNPDAWKKMDLFQIIRSGKAGLVSANLALGSYQRRLAEQFGIEPGAEMKAALQAAEQRNVDHALIDRDVGITMKRVFSAVRWWEKLSVLGGMIFSLFSSDEITEDDIEQLKQGDILENTFTEFAEQSEHLYHALISERDQYMAAMLRQSSEQEQRRNVLAVVGAGHLKGLTAELSNQTQQPTDIVEALTQIPPRGWFWRALPWLITLVILTGFGIGFARSPELGWSLVAIWVMINGTLSALGALIAGGHPLTILSGFVAAPLTSLNPTVGAGMVTAGVETLLRKPNVGDFERLRDDVLHWTGWWKNRVSRTLLVFAFSSLGSAVGTWVAGFKIFSKIA